MVEVGEEVVVSEWIAFIGAHSHEGDGEKEDESWEKGIDEWFVIESSIDFGWVFAYKISHIVADVEDDNGPGWIDVIESTGEGWSWKKDESDNECAHDDEGVG